MSTPSVWPALTIRPAPAGVLGVVSGGCSKDVAGESKFGDCIPHRPYRFGGLENIGIVAFVGHLGRTRRHYHLAPTPQFQCIELHIGRCRLDLRRYQALSRNICWVV